MTVKEFFDKRVHTGMVLCIKSSSIGESNLGLKSKKIRTIVTSGKLGWRLPEKEHEGNFWGDARIDRQFGLTSVYICQQSSNSTHKICAFHCVKYSPKRKKEL